ncbi:hypothetical protein BGX31_008586 [Mortierella sp. GBA43]|nr:hypothetical protein BGX31_008586 [Mortierella sp. GBA43]
MGQHHHALDLPEVLFRIGRHLESLDDAVACSLVCKSFHTSFEPYVWMNIHLGYSNVTKTEVLLQESLVRYISLRCYGFWRGSQGQVPRRDRILQGLQRIAPWIRALSIHAHNLPRQLNLGDQCTGINALYIAGVPRDDLFNETYWNDFEVLLRQNSASLRSLTLVRWGDRYDSPKSIQPLWRPLLTCAQHANLTTLRIRASGISEQGLEAFWVFCQQLEVLELTDLDMRDVTTHLSGSSATIASTTVRFPKLRELTLVKLYTVSDLQLEHFILQCPLLQILIWSATYSKSCWQQFCNHLAAPTWPSLDWIEIKDESRSVSDQDHALLLRSATRPLRRLDVNTRFLEEQTFNLYRERGFFATLTKLDLIPSEFTLSPSSPGSSITTMVSKQVQEVLESCPMLEYIAAVVITAQDIIQGRPWVCQRLKIFQVMIHLEISGNNHVQKGKRSRIKYTKNDMAICHQIFERLGQLKQLAVLDMRLCNERRYSDPSTILTSLPLRLRMGLGHLSTLRKLEMIGYHGSQEIRMADMDWMSRRWKNLNIAGGRLFVKLHIVMEEDAYDSSRSVMESPRARLLQLNYVTSFDQMVLGVVRSEEPEIVYCSGESDSEVDDDAESTLEILELTSLDMRDLATRLLEPPAAGTTSHSHNSSSQIGDGLTNEEQVPASATHTLTYEASIATTIVRFPKLRELTLAKLDINCEHQLELFVLHCPLLRTLIWSANYSRSCLKQFCDLTADSTWPCLDWIEIKGEGCNIDRRYYTHLLQSAPRPLRHLELHAGCLEEQIFNLYREHGHFATLTKVDLKRLVYTPSQLSPRSIVALISEQVQEVLESCPMLEHIAAMTITAQDILQGNPWVCHRLRTFEVMINMEPSDDNYAHEGNQTQIKYTEDYGTQCHRVFERLGQLKQLTVLNMSLVDQRRYTTDTIIKRTSLPLRLTMGLGHLSTLKELEVIGYYGPQEIQVADMEWILQHWKNLQRIEGGTLVVKCPNALQGTIGEPILAIQTMKARQKRRFTGGDKVEIVYYSERE